MEDAQAQVRDVIDALQRPVPDLPTLLVLLSAPLDSLGLLPPQFRRYNTTPLPRGSVGVHKHIPSFQRVLLEHIAPTWDTILAEENATPLLDQYFCPDSFSYASPVAGDVALLAYSTITAQALTTYAIYLLTRLASEYPIDRLHSAVFSWNSEQPSNRMVVWEDCVRSVMAVPAKVSNAIAGAGDVPPLLEHGTYYNNVCVRTESLISVLSGASLQDAVPSVSYLLAKLVNLGVFPPSPPVSRSQPSFFHATIPTVHARLAADTAPSYSTMWSSLFVGLPSSLTLQSIWTSMLSSLPPLAHKTGSTPCQRAKVKDQARLLDGLTGRITPEKEELWESALAVIVGKDWDIGHARVFVCWLAGGSHGRQVDENALDVLIENILMTWSSPDHVKHALLSRHQYMTSLLLITISYYPPSSSSIQSLALSPAFISGIGLYIGHTDPSVRRCGMLAAEVVADRSGKKLNFGDWEGDDSGKPWAREIRELLKQRDADADLAVLECEEGEPVDVQEISAPGVVQVPVLRPAVAEPVSGYDSDDSITGYASPPSSRAASPTPSELEEIEKDPTLNVGVKKAPRPVYLAQLGDLLRDTGGTKPSDEPHEADKIEMALNYAEELIRKKRAYGTELEENAVNLVYALIGLQDKYELEGFELKRQAALNALIACAPRKAAPALIEEFFKNQYSTFQRFIALNALALGAREMARLPIPPSAVATERIAFPSKHLPAPLHQRYLTAGQQDLIPLITDSISDNAIEKEKDAASDKVPEIVRERRLRVQKPPSIVPVPSSRPTLPKPQPPLSQTITPFTEVATEYFIAPMINRFWLFLRDEQTREERTAHFQGRGRYHGAGTGLILNPVVLAQFLRTLAILVNAAQNAPEWLAVDAPDALELAVTIGTRPVSHLETDVDDDEEHGAQRGKEASVLTAALEVALVVLDGCLEIDGGRVIGLEYTTLLLGVGEWAGGVLSHLEEGLRMQGGGGAHETKLKRAAAGVLLKIDDITSRWRRSMLDIR
ncbi:putative telomere length regulation protein [Lyophyllum shimeji]|uniref:Telomere length regulation protein n=1 Tax=Lyophyllum shimeji TaxID=47721 RepID=A0A9P3PH20_LYOSH|nr:putative telomere length regulation protein [Lyophyllum shimeji]